MKVFCHAVLFCLFLLSTPLLLLSEVPNMSNYCQLPNSIGTPIDPNVLLVVDTSGSMGWKAYSLGDKDGNDDGFLDKYVAATTYEGYFDPSKHYTPNTDGVYVETTPTGTPCTKECTSADCKSNWSWGYALQAFGCSDKKPWGRCLKWTSSGDCNVSSGNYLNYKLMSRMDVLRWVLTGGKLKSCDNTVKSCDPEVYPDSQLSCDADGCILLSTNGDTKVKVPWKRITGSDGGLLFQLKNLSPKPLIGAMFYNTEGVKKTVYIGDFTSSNNYDGVNPYKEVITSINYESPANSTPTAPALWDAYNYLAQQTPQYGGPQPQTGEGVEWKNPMNRCADTGDGMCQGHEFITVPCAKNFLILLTDGQWNMGGLPVNGYCKIDGDTEAESPDPVVPAYWLHKKGFTNTVTGVESYVESIYTVGLWLGGTGEQALKNVAMYGSFDRAKSWPGGTSGYPQDTCGPVTDCYNPDWSTDGKGSACTALPASSADWDANGDGVPDTFFKADDAVQIKNNMIDIILDILRHVSSGSAVSILASGEGSGANLLQAVYFPKKSFGSTEIDWLGKMHNLWYYVDPFLQNSNIREDTVADKKLNLSNDYAVEFYYDTTESRTVVKRYRDTGGDGSPDTFLGTGSFEGIQSLWEAGKTLWAQTSSRTIYTQLSGKLFTDFSVANASDLQSYLQAASVDEAEDIIKYIHGEDKSGYRNRTVTIDTSSGVWKLGDIVNSTPRIQSFVPVNNYHLTPPSGYSDITYSQFIKQDSYRGRGVAYVGANDGMLHAFSLGNLKQDWDKKGTYEKGWLDGSDLGKEMWAFIPKNSLPYLRYLREQDYCHLYFVDGSTFLVDASINGEPDDNKTSDSWKTILIGGMGLGGACRNAGSTCTDCIKTPVTDLGYSSYFAIDVTDPDNPVFLWEFSCSELGMSTSGPAIVREGERGKNGKWFVVFASGPTGPIDTTYRQFLGRSDQQLRLFVLDLKTGKLEQKIETGIANAFGGSLHNAALDTDRGSPSSSGHYKDDVLYLGYTKCADDPCTTSSTWTKGGVLRVVTKENADPGKWEISTVINNIGPVTASVAKLQDRRNKRLWLYFGTGRYFYKTGTSIDDPGNANDTTTIRKLYGVQEPCYSAASNDIDDTLSAAVDTAKLKDQTSALSTSFDLSSYTGWYVNLNKPGVPTGYAQERVITDPLAVFNGSVFFTTFQPSADICAVGGYTYIWALDYQSGGLASALQGKALVQVSTGEIKELSLASVFSSSKKSAGITGVPPQGQGISVLVGPKPLQKFLHIREK